MAGSDTRLMRRPAAEPPTQATAVPAAPTQAAPARPGRERLLQLQRQLGNRAVVGLVGSPVASPQVQRLVEDDQEGGEEKTFNTFDMVSGQTSTFSGLGGVQNNAYQMGNNNTPGAGAGDAGALLGGVASLGSLVGNARSVDQAVTDKATEKAAGREGQATWKDADRTHRSAGTNVGQAVGTFSSNVVSGVGGVSQIVANNGATTAFAGANNALGAAGGMIALPVQILSTIRTARKAAKQWARVVELRKRIDNPSAKEDVAKTALADQLRIVEGIRATRLAMVDQLAEERSTLSKLKAKKKAPEPSVLAAQELAVTNAEAAVTALDTSITQGEQETARLELAKDKATAAITEAGARIDAGTEGPDDIRIYALKKSQAGFTKKIIGVVGGVLGIGGGIAATVASIAAIGATAAVATATMATPVGWALCGAAALVALALGGYAFWKWASKKYDRALKEGQSKGRAFLTAINPFVKVGKSRRERNAERLYEYAAGNDPDAPGTAVASDERDEARLVMKELGLDWGTLKLDDPVHKPAAVKLIYAKLAS
jgi:hypothetical protein